jgi:salicylate hydroxylase
VGFAAIALRQQGHHVTLYERYGFAGEICAGIGIVPNGTYILEKQWSVDMSKAKPVVLKKLVGHDWKIGEVQGEIAVGDYKAKFGSHYYGAFRIDIHTALLEEAIRKDRDGPPCKLVTNYRLVGLDPETGICKFENELTTQADMVIGADGIKVQLPMCRALEQVLTSAISHKSG